MEVREIMHNQAEFINIRGTVGEAAKLMAAGDYGALPVEENDRMVGMITDRDIVLRAVADGKSPDTPVSEVMTKGVDYCFDTDNVEDAAKKMTNSKHRRLPVINRDKRLVGVLSISDFARNGQSEKTTHETLRGIVS